MGYSKDYQMRAIEYKEACHTFKELKEAFKIPASTYYSWKEQLRKGLLGVKIKRTRKRKVDPEELKRVIEEKPDAYLREIAEKFDCSITAIHKRLEQMKITLKKRHSLTQRNLKN